VSGVELPASTMRAPPVSWVRDRPAGAHNSQAQRQTLSVFSGQHLGNLGCKCSITTQVAEFHEWPLPSSTCQTSVLLWVRVKRECEGGLHNSSLDLRELGKLPGGVTLDSVSGDL
jgi:hypothetical protein